MLLHQDPATESQPISDSPRFRQAIINSYMYSRDPACGLKASEFLATLFWKITHQFWAPGSQHTRFDQWFVLMPYVLQPQTCLPCQPTNSCFWYVVGAHIFLHALTAVTFPNEGMQERKCNPLLLSTKTWFWHKLSLNIKLTLMHSVCILIHYLLVCIPSLFKNEIHVLLVVWEIILLVHRQT